MFKRLSVITAVFFLLTAFINPAFAGIYDSTKAINDAKTNYGYSDVSESGAPLNYVTSTGLSNLTDGSGYSYGFLVYGEPHGDYINGQYRYIGYTYYGEDFTNMDFPADKNAGGADFSSQNWISRPWDNQVVQANNPNLSKFNPPGLPGDGDSQYRTQILAGIMAYGATNANNGYTMNKSNNPSFWENIEQYVHILAPPTNYAWGIGRMWRYDENGNLWYVTVPIMPTSLLNQPELVVTPESATIYVGENLQYTATYYPNGQANGNGQDVTNHCVWSIGDSSIATIGTYNGLATGASPGTTDVTAAYTVNGKTLQGQAELIVEEQEEEEPPESDYSGGGLSFQAVSQDKSTYREAGKALWTDYVTATLKLPVQTVVREGESPDYRKIVAPPRPRASECSSSYSEITGWRIVSADLSYPKQHPEFTFGHPLPPVGVETIPMEVAGQSAKATFQELWAMDGAYVYDFLNDTMINQKPKNYPITASNIVVEVEYSMTYYHEEIITVCSGSGDDEDCWNETICVSETETGSYTQHLDPVVGQLLVYGTAVDSRAQ